jgi:Bacterial pre-peptidase C-terminal domain
MRAKLWFGAAAAAFMMAGATPFAFAQDADQPGDSSTQASIAPDQTAAGDISPAGDTDWYRLHVEHGQRYSLTLNGVPAETGDTLDPMLAVYDGAGNQLAFNDDANGLNSALSYVPAQTGDVFVEARGFGDQAVGRYELNVSAAPIPPDDAGNDAGTRARVRAGVSVNGAIEYEGDVDWYRLSARTGQRYHITLAGAGGDNSLADPYLRVVDAGGTELASNDDSDGLNSALDFIPTHGGDVFVVAGAFSDSYAGAYALNVTSERAPHDSTSADVNTHGRIALGQTVTANLDFAGDRDWYRVNLEGGQSYRFAMAGAGASPVDDTLIKVYDAHGAELAMDDDSGEGFNSYLEFAAPSTGVYYLEARGFSDDAIGGYSLAAFEGDIANGPQTDVALSADGDAREGVLTPAGDRDWYRVAMKDGQTIRVGLSGAGGPDSLRDPLVAIHGADGVEIMRDDDGGEGLNSWLEFTAPAEADYFINVQSFAEDETGRYVVTVTPGEIGADANSAESITPSGDARVSLINQPGDVDWYRVDMIEGRPYRFNLQGGDAPGPLSNPVLTLLNEEGVQVAADNDGGAGVNSYLTFTPTTSGAYYAAVSGYQDAWGNYSLSVSDTEVPGNPGTDETLDAAAGDSRTSRIDMPGDLDDYHVELEAGVRYTIEVRGTGDNPLTDPFLAVLNGNNERVTSDDDSGPGLDARLRFTPTEGGTFFLQASGLGGSTGWYQISIVRQ